MRILRILVNYCLRNEHLKKLTESNPNTLINQKVNNVNESNIYSSNDNNQYPSDFKTNK